MRLSAGPKSVVLLLVALASFDVACAEKLPLRHFTTQEGLAGNIVHSIMRDSRGLLWFSTNDGLSRFDGHSFVNFGIENGLGDQEVTHLLETSDGTYWVGTARGVSRMQARSSGGATASFTNFLPSEDRRSQWIQRLIEDHEGRIWMATNGGLYRMNPNATGDPAFEHIPLPPAESKVSPRVLVLIKDHFGQIWSGGDRGLHRHLDDGSIDRYSMDDGLPSNIVLALALDNSGALWVGVDEGLCRVRAPRLGRAVVDRVYNRSVGLPDDYVATIHATNESLFVGTLAGLVRIPIAPAEKLEVFGPTNGLRHPNVESLAEDGQGNIWIGSMGGGVSRLSPGGFTTFGLADGLASLEVAGFVETSAGQLYAISKGRRQFALNLFNGQSFVPIRPRFPPAVTGFGWGWAQIALQDSLGEWWIATGEGVVRYIPSSADQLAFSIPRAFYRTTGELPSGNVFRIFADSRADLWISTSDTEANGLSRWERRTGRIQQFRQQDGLPGPEADGRSLASAFAEDASGTVWIGFHRGGLFRVHAGQLLAVRAPEDALSEGIRWIHHDAAGRLWIAGRRGLLRLDEPGAEQPVFHHYGIAEGLASNFVLSLTEDHLGRIYVGSGRGVDRLDPRTGMVRRYGPSDGLVGGEILAAHRDQQGYLWFASTEGVSRYDPRQEWSAPAPSAYISHISIGNYAHELAPNGEKQIAVPPLSWRHNSFQVEFLGVGEALRYQYQLEGIDTSWSEVSEWRSVTYPGLGAGNYRFLVRALDREGTWSPRPATVSFRIMPPFWGTWWFRLIVAAIALATVVSFHRMHVAKALALERIRHRIARDLHDDVGASLSHAALLSDLAQRQNTIQSISTRDRLQQISSACRQALDSMTDIVWATDPQRDDVGNLIQRMRSFGEEMLAAQGVELHLSDYGVSSAMLPPRIRYQLFMVFKEAIHNVVQHSGATTVRVELGATIYGLSLRIADNGRGLPPAAIVNGHGLHNMQDRVTALGGTMHVDAGGQGSGTILEFAIPLARVRG